jgi:hypothetical protein
VDVDVGRITVTVDGFRLTVYVSPSTPIVIVYE